MAKSISLATAACVFVVSMSGCCCSPCFNNPSTCPPNPTWTGFGNARIAPPATNSYQVASGSQPYYAPGSTSTSAGGWSGATLNGTVSSALGGFDNTTGVSAEAQAGWRQPDLNGSPGFYGSPNPSTLNAQSTSFQSPSDYQSTAIDERLDATRLPANDATAVRAPTHFNPQGNWQMLNPSGSVANVQIPGQLEYRTSPQINGWPPSTLSTAASSPLIGYPSMPPQNQTPPVVLAQASTAPETLARDPNYQAGWRDRFTGGNFINR